MSRPTFSSGSRALPFRRSTLCLALWAGFVSAVGAQEQRAGSAPTPATQDQAGEAGIDSALDEILSGDIGSEPQGEATAAPAASADTASTPDSAAPVQADAAAPTQGETSFEELETIPVLTREKQEPQSLPEPSHRGQIEEIVVTATKREQSVRDIPMTVDVLTGDKLEQQGARELQDFVDQVPGLQIQDVAVTGSRKIVIRGIAPDNTTNQTVGVLLGDIPLGDPIGSYTVVDPDTWDLATVEVLKGPQGSLFGASSLAGVIRYVPQAPKLETWEGKAFTEWATVKDGGSAPTFGAALNLPVGSTLAFRLSGVSEQRPGIIDIDNPLRQEKDADEARKWSGRAMVLWQPTDRLTVNAWYTAQERKADEAFYVTNFDADYTRYDAPQSSPTERYFDLSTLDVRYEFDWATLVSLTAYQTKQNRFDFDGTYALAGPLGELGLTVGRTKRDVDAEGMMQELRLVSPDGGDWTWQAGAFYSVYDASVASDIYTPVPLLPRLRAIFNALPAALRDSVLSERGISIGRQTLDPLEASEAALFGELSRRLGSVTVTLGGRLYSTEVSGVSTTSGLIPVATTRELKSVEPLDVKDKGFSPKLAVAWEATDDMLVYGSVSRGFQYGGVNAVAIPNPNSEVPPTYKSSTLWAYEAGVRTDWLDRSLRLDLSAYYQRWSDAQVSQVAPPAEAYIDNVGEVEVKGVELSLRYLLPIDGLLLETSGGYLDSRTAAEFKDGDGEPVPAGSTMPNAPRLQASASLSYSRLFGDVWNTSTALQFSHNGFAWGSVQHQGRLEARNMLNFNFSLTRTDLSFIPTLGLIVNNITDERKMVSATKNEEDDTFLDLVNWTVGYTRPRSVILRFGVEFK